MCFSCLVVREGLMEIKSFSLYRKLNVGKNSPTQFLKKNGSLEENTGMQARRNWYLVYSSERKLWFSVANAKLREIIEASSGELA